MSGIRVPIATYRVQFYGGVGLREAEMIVPYLQALGVSDLYASPLLQARAGTTHGYDVTDPSRVSRELGTLEEFVSLTNALHSRGMGLLLDMVPNHMSASHENPWWYDVLRRGYESAYAGVFDIDWHPLCTPVDGRVVLPVLGAPYGEVLEAGELRLSFDAGGSHLKYGDRRFPITVGERADEAGLGKTVSVDELDRLLMSQSYRLAYWKTGREKLNYRRFFDISDLVAIRAEEPDVFELTHQRVLEWVAEGRVSGLRLDHVDGLADPTGYLERLRERLGSHVAFVVVEKILGEGEAVPQDWPIDGTTGYDFLNDLNGVFVDQAGCRMLENGYLRFVGANTTFDDTVY